MHRWYEPDDLYWDSEFDDVESGMENVSSDITVRKVVVMGFYTGGACDEPEIEEEEEWEYEVTWLEWIVSILNFWRRWTV